MQLKYIPNWQERDRERERERERERVHFVNSYFFYYLQTVREPLLTDSFEFKDFIILVRCESGPLLLFFQRQEQQGRSVTRAKGEDEEPRRYGYQPVNHHSIAAPTKGERPIAKTVLSD